MFLHAVKKTFQLYNLHDVMELNDAESFDVGYWNYETVQKIVKRRLSQRIVRNDSLFGTIFSLFRSIIQVAEVSSGFGMIWKQNEVKTSFKLRQ